MVATGRGLRQSGLGSRWQRGLQVPEVVGQHAQGSGLGWQGLHWASHRVQVVGWVSGARCSAAWCLGGRLQLAEALGGQAWSLGGTCSLWWSMVPREQAVADRAPGGQDQGLRGSDR